MKISLGVSQRLLSHQILGQSPKNTVNIRTATLAGLSVYRTRQADMLKAIVLPQIGLEIPQSASQ